MSVLLVDAGNSRIKWGVHADGAWRERGWTPSAEPALERQWAALPAPREIVVANVAGAVAAESIRAACRRWRTPPRFVRAVRTQCGVSNGYATAESLGADRWSALIAARRLCPGDAVLVVQAGTAVTVDSLDASGRFPGGLILPGLNLMLAALERNTAGLSHQPGNIVPFPACTADAMYSGAADAIAGAIERSFRRLAGATVCLLAGGDADILLPLLGIPARKHDNLVLEGLLHIALES